jgi:hypothetical protein
MHTVHVVGNPGGIFGVLGKFFRGGTRGCQKIYGRSPLFRDLLHFYVTIFGPNLT